MPRKKISEKLKLKTEGIGLTGEMLRRVGAVADAWGVERSDAGRELLLLGLTIVESLQRHGVMAECPHLTVAYREEEGLVEESEIKQDANLHMLAAAAKS